MLRPHGIVFKSRIDDMEFLLKPCFLNTLHDALIIHCQFMILPCIVEEMHLRGQANIYGNVDYLCLTPAKEHHWFRIMCRGPG